MLDIHLDNKLTLKKIMKVLSESFFVNFWKKEDQGKHVYSIILCILDVNSMATNWVTKLAVWIKIFILFMIINEYKLQYDVATPLKFSIVLPYAWIFQFFFLYSSFDERIADIILPI